MTQPAHLELSSSIPAEHHATIIAGVALAASLINTDLSETEVHVKQSARLAHGSRNSGSHMTGMAYYWYRDRANGDRRPGGLAPQTGAGMVRVQPGTRYLVTLKLTKNFAAGVYPYTRKYWRLKTAPEYTVYTWLEELVHLAAHEFNHIAQYVNGWQHSEIHCEQVALDALHKARRLLDAASAANVSTIGKAASR